MLVAAIVVTSTFSASVISKAETMNVSHGTVEVKQGADSVTICNGAIERTFSTKDSKLSTTQIVNKRTSGGETSFTPGEDSEEFIIRTTKEKSKPIDLPALDRKKWQAEADSYHNGTTGAADGPASNLLDGNVDTIWHTNYGGGNGGKGDQEYPYNVVIQLDGSQKFKAFSYTPRKEGEATNGNIKGYELYASNETSTLPTEAKEWGEPIAKGEFEYDGGNPIYVNLEKECTATQIKFVATSSTNGKNFAGGAEFNLHKDMAPIIKGDREFKASDLTLKDGNEAVKVESTNAEINGQKKTGKKVTFSFKPYEHKAVEYSINEVIVMYEGDHFMRKYLEITVPEDKQTSTAIDYIDLESFKVNQTDKQWTIPRGKGGIVQMEEFKANLGQPIYIQGMFFGCEFPATDTEIVDGTGYMRYYTGKTFDRLKKDNQLTKDGKYVTWQTVVGAARSTENEVIQADFYEYINSIATPSEFRIQYNSWFDNMMKINDNNILESFMEIDRELNNAEVRPMDSYVVDDGWNAYNNGTIPTHEHQKSGAKINQSGFWEFNEKFPNELTPSSQLVQKFGSNFGVWVGPRGGYNFYGTLADIIQAKGKGSKAGGSIDVADRVYVENFKNMAVEWQKKFQVNYWKWDGFADMGQYNHFNNLGGADGVPVYSESNHHMTGGYHQMYHVTDLWEAWIDLMEAVRQSEKEDGINKLWISLTCYVNPSPWYLQWANSVWLQCTHDQKDAGFGTTKMNKQITYRDACYYDFLKNHQFQFPLQNIYNHDPVYGKEDTGMNANTATDEDFQNYLYMLSTRGTAFWELYYSDSIMTDGKYEITGEFLEWAEKNYHMLKNSKMIGGMPDKTSLGSATSDASKAEAYGFSCFDGKDGIISLRNPSATENKAITFTFDRTLGVSENAGTLNYYLEHSYLLSDLAAQTGELTYGQKYTVNLKPNEVRILRVSDKKDTIAPEIDRIMTDGKRKVTVKFNEKVYGNLLSVSGMEIASIEKSADDTTYHITLTKEPKDGATITVIPKDIKDMTGNKAGKPASVTYHADNVIIETEVKEGKRIIHSDQSLHSKNGFTVAAIKKATGNNESLVKQNNEYELKIAEDGRVDFTLNGITAVSSKKVNDNREHIIVGVKENNGMLKLYVDGKLEGSAYKKENRFNEVEKADITVGENVTKVGVYDVAYGYNKVEEIFREGLEKLKLNDGMVTVSGTEEGNKNTIFDGNNTTYWTSQKVTNSTMNTSNAWLKVDLGSVYKLAQVDYTPRFHNDAQNYWCCTGNIKKVIVEISKDGNTWTPVTENGGRDLSNKIVKKNDSSFFPEKIKFDEQEARYVRIGGTESYHWEEENVNKQITVADLAIYGEKIEKENIAKESTVIARWTKDNTNAASNNDRPMSMVVDEQKTNADGNYGEFGADNKDESSYMQIDLGTICDVEALNLYRYWNDNRTYRDTVVAVAKAEKDFADGKAIILYNSDENNFHKLNEAYKKDKYDDEYAESSAGKSWQLPEKTKAQFIRVYMHGSTSGTTNHVVEMEVIGVKPKDESTSVDLTKLIARLEELEEVDTANATLESVEKFNALVKEGYDLVSTGAKTQDEVDDMLKKLEGAEDILVHEKPEINESELKKAIVEAEKVNDKQYTIDSYHAMKKVLDETKALLEEGAKDQSEVDAKTKMLNDAIKALEKRGNTDGLKKLVEKYRELNAKDFTNATWNVFAKAFAEAEVIIKDNSNSTQEKVDVVRKTLEDAYNALEKVDETVVDKSKLEETYNQYKNLKKDDYTQDSWQVFENALNNVKTVLDDKNVTEDQANKALAQLERAVEKLEKVQNNENAENTGTGSNGENAGANSNGGVETGDSSNMMLWGSIMTIALVSGIVGRKKKY